MVAGQYDFIIERGATFNPILTLKDENGSAINITGYAARMKVKERLKGSLLLSIGTATSGMTIPVGTDGKINLSISAANTGALNPRIENGVYDIEIQDGSGTVTRILEGIVTFTGEITD